MTIFKLIATLTTLFLLFGVAFTATAQDGGTHYAHTNTKGVTYYLHSTVTEATDGSKRKFYFFAKTKKADKIAEPKVPDTHVVSETRSGLPVLKKKK